MEGGSSGRGRPRISEQKQPKTGGGRAERSRSMRSRAPPDLRGGCERRGAQAGARRVLVSMRSLSSPGKRARRARCRRGSGSFQGYRGSAGCRGLRRRPRAASAACALRGAGWRCGRARTAAPPRSSPARSRWRAVGAHLIRCRRAWGVFRLISPGISGS